ncbi:MAG: GDP-L-fucose synthase [Sulfuricella sp.]|jgi:GDP-L-fucose synthase
MERNAKIYVAGHRGLVGAAIVRRLSALGYDNIITRTHAELDLLDQRAVADFFACEWPEYVFLAAAKVGGIQANNTYRGEFIYNNLMIQSNIINQSLLHGVTRLLFLGSSCIYPKFCPQPMKEEHLMTGPLEATNSPYAVAKIAGIEMCWAYNRQYGTHFIPVMPTNLYGPNDNFDLENSHVLPALIRKFHLAGMAARGDMKAIRKDEKRFGRIPDDVKSAIGLDLESASLAPASSSARVIVWGSGTPKREFLHVDDMADACVHVMAMEKADFHRRLAPQSAPLLNIGTGVDCSTGELAQMIKEAVGFSGELVFDGTKPDGTPRKLLDVSRVKALGWQAGIGLEEGIRQVCRWYEDELRQ